MTMLASILSTFPTYHSEPEHAENPHNGRTVTDGIDVSYEYLNMTMQEITISLRCGLKLRIPAIYDIRKLPAIRTPKVIIRATYRSYMGANKELQRCAAEAKEDGSKTILLMRKQIENQLDHNRHANFISIIDYPVYLDDIKRNGGCVYSNDGDIMVSLLSLEKTPFHPFSKEARNVENIREHADVHKEHEIQFMIKIIDNHSTMSPKFYNIGNEVYKVVPYSDNTQEEGIYFISSSPVKSILQNENKVISHHRLDAASTLGLFSTIEDALCFGDPALMRKGILAEMEHKNLMTKKELELSKLEFEKEKIEIEKNKRVIEEVMEKERLQREFFTREQEKRILLEELEMKNRYEKQSYFRKNTSEIIKFIPALVAAITAVVVVVRKVVVKA